MPIRFRSDVQQSSNFYIKNPEFVSYGELDELYSEIRGRTFAHSYEYDNLTTLKRNVKNLQGCTSGLLSFCTWIANVFRKQLKIETVLSDNEKIKRTIDKINRLRRKYSEERNALNKKYQGLDKKRITARKKFDPEIIKQAKKAKKVKIAQKTAKAEAAKSDQRRGEAKIIKLAKIEFPKKPELMSRDERLNWLLEHDFAETSAESDLSGENLSPASRLSISLG